MRPRRLIFTVVLICAFCASVLAQNAMTAEWVRLQSDNGEFSIEVPKDFSYFFDADGFIVGSDSRDFPVRDMRLCNAYLDGTLVSFEIYRADSEAMSELLDGALERGSKKRKTKFRNIDVREVIRNEDKADPGSRFYAVSRYFRSKEFVYILTGLSRTTETPVMTRFFNSLTFDPNSASPVAGLPRLSELKVSPVDVVNIDPPAANRPMAPTPQMSPPVDPTYRPALVAIKPRASYVERARDNNVNGDVRLRLDLNTNGYIPKIEVMRSLPDGLVRQSIFAALRLKFLPAERGGKLVRVRKTLEYNFKIY
jgi:hypothetical protein